MLDIGAESAQNVNGGLRIGTEAAASNYRTPIPNRSK
jgi:hypothetical protein